MPTFGSLKGDLIERFCIPKVPLILASSEKKVSSRCLGRLGGAPGGRFAQGLASAQNRRRM